MKMKDKGLEILYNGPHSQESVQIKITKGDKAWFVGISVEGLRNNFDETVEAIIEHGPR